MKVNLKHNSISVTIQFKDAGDAERAYFYWIGRGCEGFCQNGRLMLCSERSQKRFDLLTRWLNNVVSKRETITSKNTYIVRRG